MKLKIKKIEIEHWTYITTTMTYESLKTFKTKLLTFFSNKIIECNHKVNEYTVDLYFPEYNIAVQIYEVNDAILNVKKFREDTNCMFRNVNLDKHHFDPFTEKSKIKDSLFNIIKNKLSDNEKLITWLSIKIKEIHDTLLEFKC